MRNLTCLLENLKPVKKVLIIGSAFVDIVVDIKDFPKSGSDIEGFYKDTKVGGCAFNVADVLAKLALPFDSYLPIGEGNIASIVEKEFDRRNYPKTKISNRGDNGWCLSLVEQSGERTFISISGIETKYQEEDFNSYDLKSYDIVYISGYQLDHNCEVLLKILDKLKNSAQIVFDPGPRINKIEQSVFDFLEKKNLIYTINKEEALNLSHCGIIEDALDCIYLRTKNPVIVTDGGNGAYVADENSVRKISGFSIKVADTIGSGDSHTGGIIAGLMCNFSLDETVLFANKIASIVTSRMGGATAPTIDELKNLI